MKAKQALLSLGTIAATLVFLTLPACDFKPTPEGLNHSQKMAVKGFEDCTYMEYIPGNYQPKVYVVRCPNSSTTVKYPQGKTTAQSITIDIVDGEVRIRKEENKQ